ncbi:hypothetical protein CHCC20442_4338 [Bacillus licheniformis]|uniref:ORF6C domain-containing protein n=1 Tax=Bacillus licheniformis TaxID=1402 RepID=UPI0011A5DE0C|nr:ORF6C domain-containing protein [Bacillus licheniformis]TWK08625.1 hypothetical protein CHCC20442_4338 [Bacillus licheniformis]
MNDLQVFGFKENEMRTIILNDEPWFVAKDVCDILEIKNTTQAVSKLDDDERTMFNIGRQGEVNIVNEFGLYNLVLASRKKEAKLFKRWITHEVIPSIRKTGGYHEPMSKEDIMIATLENQKEIKKRLNNVTDDVEDLKKEIDLSRTQKAKLSKIVRSNAMQAVGGKRSNAYKTCYRKAISEHWREIKNYFEVASYEEIPKIKYEEAVEVAGMWSPSIELAYEIKRANNQTDLGV